MKELYRFQFTDEIPSGKIAQRLLLAAINTENVFGEAAMRLDAKFRIDKPARVVEIEIDLGRRRDAKFGVVVDDRGPILGVLHHALDAVEEVDFEGGFRVVAKPRHLAGHFGLHLLGCSFRAEIADGLDF